MMIMFLKEELTVRARTTVWSSSSSRFMVKNTSDPLNSNFMDESFEKIGRFPVYFALFCVFFSCSVSLFAIFSHLKNYRRPNLQRYIIRIIWMVPIFAISSLTTIISYRVSDYMDIFKDIYEAFVIYTFFHLLVNFLGGERDLLVKLEDRPMMSDPSTFLNIRRGILQFVLIKPILTLLQLVLKKCTNQFVEDEIGWKSPFTWINLIYNISIFLAMYCLVLFYLQSSKDLSPYRPFPKYICIKSIIFFSYWQGLFISILVNLNLIRGTKHFNSSIVASSVQAFLICIECVGFAFGHWSAFSWRDYDDSRLSSRLTLKFALRDAIGIKDIVQDTWHTFKGTTFRYVPLTHETLLEREEEDQQGNFVFGSETRFHKYRRNKQKLKTKLKLKETIIRDGKQYQSLSHQHEETVEEHEDLEEDDLERGFSEDGDSVTSLEFHDVDAAEDEEYYEQSRVLVYGDANFPVVHEDPRFAHPPHVQEEIKRKAQEAKLKWIQKLQNEKRVQQQQASSSSSSHTS